MSSDDLPEPGLHVSGLRPCSWPYQNSGGTRGLGLEPVVAAECRLKVVAPCLEIPNYLNKIALSIINEIITLKIINITLILP